MHVSRSDLPPLFYTTVLLALFAPGHALAAQEMGTAEAATRQVELQTLRVESDLSSLGYGTARQQTTRLGTPVQETPRAISVIPRELLDDQFAITERDVLRNAAGVTTRSEYHGSYSQFSIRGLWANNTYNYFRDGTRFVHLLDPPLFNVKQVEVIKGPSSIDFGQIAPGGLINYVSKRPSFEPMRSLQLGLGSHAYREVEADLTGPVGDSETVAYRLTGSVMRGGAFTDHINPEQQGLGGSLLWQLTDATSLNLLAERQELDRRSNPGLPVPDPLDPESADRLDEDNYYGERGLTTDGHTQFASAELAHQFSPALAARVVVSHNETMRNVKLVYPFGPTVNGSVARSAWIADDQSYVSRTALGELKAEMVTGPIEHEAVVGIDYREVVSRYGNTTSAALAPLDLYQPVATGEPLPIANGFATTRSRADNTALFAQDRLRWGAWSLLLGLRHDRFEDDKAKPQLDFEKTLPMAALTWQLTPSQMLYVSYVESFQANSGTRLVGERSAAPSEGKQWEAGLKSSWLGGALQSTVSLFDLTLTNVPTPDPSHPGYATLTGEQRVRGIEMEASGQLTDSLSIVAQASVLDAEIVRDNSATVERGNQVAYAASSSGSLWLRYDVPALRSLWVAAGVYYQDDIYLGNDNRWQLPGYTTDELAAGYTFKNGISIQANLRNLTDERYYIGGTSNANGFTSVDPGAPRTLYVSSTIPF